MTPLLLTVEQAAERLNVPLGTLRKMTAARQVQHTRVGKLVRFSTADLEVFIASRRVDPIDAPTREQVVSLRATGGRRRPVRAS